MKAVARETRVLTRNRLLLGGAARADKPESAVQTPLRRGKGAGGPRRCWAGWTLQRIISELQISYPALVRLLTQEGMETARSARLRIRKDTHQAGLPAIDIRCHTHGVTRHVYRNSNERYRCAICATASVVRSRRASKHRLVEAMGGECWICGYRRSDKSLQFHHIDPSTKSFNISMRMALSDARLRLEARKCALLCANCHGEVEAGEIVSPRQPPPHLNVPIWDEITLDEALAA